MTTPDTAADAALDHSPYRRDRFDAREFFTDFWRRKPLFVKGGAAEFLGRTWTSSDFDGVVDAARRVEGAVAERPGEVTFLENVSRFHDDLAARAGGFARMFGSPQAWFDTIRTYRPAGGIGAHFDHSDNFVLQQEGVKVWSLASPENLGRDEIAARMMNVPSVGGHELPEQGTVRFDVEPGDLLYIPLFWLHSGVSDAASLSLSLVCPAVSLQSATVSALLHVVRSRSLGYQPVPALHGELGEEERERVLGNVERATRTLLQKLSAADVVDAVVARQAEQLGSGRGVGRE